MQTFILVVSSLVLYPGKIPARTVFDYRSARGIWPFSEHTRHKLSIEKDDLLIFYFAGEGEGAKNFVASARAQSQVKTTRFLEPREWCTTPYNLGLEISTPVLFPKMVPIIPLKQHLSFIKNPDNPKWGAYLQGGCIKATENDAVLILAEAGEKE